MTALIARDAWSAAAREPDPPKGRTFSLEPKIGSHRVGVRFGLHW